MGTKHPSRVIVGIQESVAGLRALRMAVAEARRRGASLYALRAWPYSSPVRGAVVPPWQDDLAQEAANVVRRAFDVTMGGIPTDFDVFIATVEGAPGPALVRFADRDEDVLCVGVGRRRWWHRLLGAGVAGYCVAHATCPVLAVPPDSFARNAPYRRLRRELDRDLALMSARHSTGLGPVG